MKRYITVVLALVLIFQSVGYVFAGDLEDAINQKSYYENQISNLNKQKIAQQGALNRASDEKKNLDNALVVAENDLNDRIAELNFVIDQLLEIESSINDSENKYYDQVDLFENRLVAMYKSSSYTFVQTLLESKSINDFFGRLKLLTLLSKKDKSIMEQIDIAKKDMEFKKSLKEVEKKDAVVLESQKRKEVDITIASRAAADEQARSASSSLRELERQIDYMNQQSQVMEKVINELANRNRGIYSGGSMAWPAPGYGGVSSYFGNRLHPVFKTYKMHTGIDINAPYGAVIVSANKGTVILAGWQEGYGNTIVVNHGGGITTLYAHAASISTYVGAAVDAGSVLGRVGSTGLSTGAHLHFEYRVNGAPQNPLDYVSP